MIGADLLKEELEKVSPPKRDGWIMILDGAEGNHNILVKNVISDKGPHAILPKLEDKKITFFNIDNGSEIAYKTGENHKKAISEYEVTFFPGDHLFGYKKRPPHFINNSMGWGESEDIYKVFESFSLSLSNTLIIMSAGNKFPEKLSEIKTKASKNFNSILVGSFSPRGFVSSFSQSGEAVTILAPSDQWLTSTGKYKEYKRFGGTSGSAPLVTGSLAGFEWLSGYHPTSKESKVLLEKTALPILHSHEKPRINGAGLLNSYKLGEVAKRLKQKCKGKSTSCFKEEILKEETYHFTEDKNLIEELNQVFPYCVNEENVENLLELSSCHKMDEALKELRKAVLLNPRKALLKSLSCLYSQAGFLKNREMINKLSLAQGSSEEVRAELKALVKKEEALSDDIIRLMLGMGGFEEEFKLYENKQAITMASGLGSKGLPLLEKAIAVGDFDLQWEAISSAERIGEEAVPLLEKIFDTGNFILQERVIHTAGKIGGEGLSISQKAIDTGEFELQWIVASSTEKMGKEALPLVNKIFDTNNLILQKKAIGTAGRMGKEALPLIEKAFKTGHPELQALAIDSAEQIGEPALPFLKNILKQKDIDQNIKELIEYRINRILQS